MPKSDFEICRILVELFVLKLSINRFPAFNDSVESKTAGHVLLFTLALFGGALRAGAFTLFWALNFALLRLRSRAP
jgi:hypothetical protein